MIMSSPTNNQDKDAGYRCIDISQSRVAGKGQVGECMIVVLSTGRSELRN